jgi:type IV pilus assembly protein PilX
MNSPGSKFLREHSRTTLKQRGVVLFFTLIALVVMSLAAVALIRSVDTSTMIAGNLSFKQAATNSGDHGVEAAIAWLSSTEKAMENAGLNVYKDTAHLFNSTNAATGYYSNLDPSLSLTDGTGIQWNNNDSVLVTSSDVTGNQIRYVIQRMCRTANELPATIEQPLLSPPKTGCMFSSAALNNSGQSIPYASDVCRGAGCPTAGQTALIRITAQVIGPRNTVSYIQTVVY